MRFLPFVLVMVLGREASRRASCSEPMRERVEEEWWLSPVRGFWGSEAGFWPVVAAGFWG